LRNEGGSSRSIEYRFDWFDEDGVDVSPLRNSFAVLALGAGETREVTGSASARATDFRFTVRNAPR
jgi:uncharacterized protein YcfL